MSGTYKLSPETERSLEEIEDYTARRWGEAQAERYLRDIFAAFAALANEPGLGRRRADIPEPYLVYSVGSHLIIYRDNRNTGWVEILNILHPSMNIEQRMRQALVSMAKKKLL